MTGPTTTSTSAAGAATGLDARALLEGAVALIRAHPRALLLPLVLLGMVEGFVDSEVGDVFERGFPGGGGVGLLEPILDGLESFLNVIFLVFIAASILFVLVTARAAFMPIRGEGAPAFSLAYHAVRRVYFRGVLALLPVTGLMVIGFFVLFVPGVLVLAAFLAVPAVVVAEGHTFLGALARSWELTKPRLLDAFLVALVVVAVAALPALLFGWIPVLGSIVAGAAQGAAIASAAVLSTLYYARALHLPVPQPLARTDVTASGTPLATTAPPTPAAPSDVTSRPPQ